MPPELRSYLPSEPTDIVQIAMIWVAFYLGLRLVRGTIAASILRGAIVLVIFAVVTAAVVLRAFHLRVVEQIFTALGNVTVIAVLVIFQPELRRGLLNLGQHRLFSRFRPRVHGALDEICAAVTRLARDQTGALLAIERGNLLHHIARSGVAVDAECRADLLVSIFWPGSPLHDGGAVLRGDRVAAAGCIFPLAERTERASDLGTRHRAALGLSEESDAIVVVVSEETGRVSIAVHGELRPVAPPDLKESLQRLLGPQPAQQRAPRLRDQAAQAVAAEESR